MHLLFYRWTIEADNQFIFSILYNFDKMQITISSNQPKVLNRCSPLCYPNAFGTRSECLIQPISALDFQEGNYVL